MESSHNTDLFERALEFPDSTAKERLDALVGLDHHKQVLAKTLSALVRPSAIVQWLQTQYPKATALPKLISRRPPLIILAGDVGSGKTELAETISDAVARQEKIQITLYPLSLSARGQGRVGEMTALLSGAIDRTITSGRKLKSQSGDSRGAIVLLIDEADALAQSREASQMHHEDRAGVNALIRGIDRIANEKLAVAVIMCTNRLTALDPAIRRRAATILTFNRPDEKQRLHLLSSYFSDLGFSKADLEAVAAATGIQKDRDHGFTFSDLTQRLIPEVIFDAYPHTKITPSRVLSIANAMTPTPPFQDKSS